MGCATAYYLTRLSNSPSYRGRRVRPLLVDRRGVAGAASGIAAGFLPRRHMGMDPGVDAQLHEQGFQQIQALASELPLESYAPLPGWCLGGPPSSAATVNSEELPSWLDRLDAGTPAAAAQSVGEAAQVDPRELMDKLFQASEKLGAELILSRVEGVRAEGEPGQRKVTGVRLEGGQVLDCEAAVVALGPWSVLAEDWFEGLRVPMRGTLGTAAVYHQPADSLQPGVVMCSRDEHGRDLEVMVRDNGQVYCLGFQGGHKVVSADALKTLDAEDVAGDPGDLEATCGAFQAISSVAEGKAPDEIRAGLRPVMVDHVPLTGKIPGYGDTAFLSCGHNCYGLVCGPAAGLALAEQILYGEARSLDLGPFSPARGQLLASLRC